MAIALGIISAIFLIDFIYTFFHHVINFGNIFGTFICIVVITLCIVYRTCNVSRIFTIVLSILTGICILDLAICSGLMILACKKNTADVQNKTHIIIVLGCKVNGNNPSLMLSKRIEKASEIYKKSVSEYSVQKIICSGGQGQDEIISEAECMKRYLIKSGIPASDIIQENKSTSTNENIKFSKEIIKEKYDISSTDITIVTNEFHMYRSLKIAEKYGIKALSAYCHTKPSYLPTFWIREVVAINAKLISITK